MHIELQFDYPRCLARLFKLEIGESPLNCRLDPHPGRALCGYLRAFAR